MGLNLDFPFEYKIFHPSRYKLNSFLYTQFMCPFPHLCKYKHTFSVFKDNELPKGIETINITYSFSNLYRLETTTLDVGNITFEFIYLTYTFILEDLCGTDDRYDMKLRSEQKDSTFSHDNLRL